MDAQTNPCPRCRGTLIRTADLGETYFSCVQCGHQLPANVRPASRPVEVARRWEPPVAADRQDVRRRLIHRERERAAKRAARAVEHAA